MAVLLSIFIVNAVCSWGFLGHKTINNKAVFALPSGLFLFYKTHLEFITTHAVDADSRRYLFAGEGCRHYLDCDYYEHCAPMDTLPHNWFKAVERYTEDTLRAHGIVPWHCLLMQKQLTKAFGEKDVRKILKTSSDLGHYVADAHVPLHTTGNYNGQRTGQEGIHALWETRIPQLFLDSFDLLTGTVKYLENPNEFIWNVINESFRAVDSVLRIEKQLSEFFISNKYAFENINNQTKLVYSFKFCERYHSNLDNMVAKRMQKSIYAVASFWYTSWVDAGQPDMGSLKITDISDPEDEKLKKAVEHGKIKGREEHGHEGEE